MSHHHQSWVMSHCHNNITLVTLDTDTDIHNNQNHNDNFWFHLQRVHYSATHITYPNLRAPSSAPPETWQESVGVLSWKIVMLLIPSWTERPTWVDSNAACSCTSPGFSAWWTSVVNFFHSHHHPSSSSSWLLHHHHHQNHDHLIEIENHWSEVNRSQLSSTTHRIRFVIRHSEMINRWLRISEWIRI